MSLAALGGHAPGFDEPIDMLDACHGRIGAQCDTLRRLVPHVAAHGADTAAREAARAVLRYFDTAGVNHHLDEEDDLFPALAARAPGEATAALLAGLRAEHAAMLAAWQQRVSPALTAIAAGEPHVLDADMVEDFTGMYRRHIAREERELIPLARAVLDAAARAALGRTMAARRAVASPTTGG